MEDKGLKDNLPSVTIKLNKDMTAEELREVRQKVIAMYADHGCGKIIYVKDK